MKVKEVFGKMTETSKKWVVYVVLVVVSIVAYTISTNLKAIGDSLMDFPFDWLACIVIGAALKSLADFISPRISLKKFKKSNS